MGTENNRLEMLFICSAERGKGIGKQLLKYGIEKFGIKEPIMMKREIRILFYI